MADPTDLSIAEAREALLRKDLSAEELARAHIDAIGKIDIKLVLWEYGQMKTTLEIPDDLMRRVKMRAVQRNQKLKDTVATLLEAGIAAASDSA